MQCQEQTNDAVGLLSIQTITDGIVINVNCIYFYCHANQSLPPASKEKVPLHHQGSNWQ